MRCILTPVMNVEACVAKWLTPRTLDLEVRDTSLRRRVVLLDEELFSTLSLFTQVYTPAMDYRSSSLHSKRFRLVSEQRNTEEGNFRFCCATFLAVFDSRSSFFSPKPYRNACYAGYRSSGRVGLWLVCACTFFFFFYP